MTIMEELNELKSICPEMYQEIASKYTSIEAPNLTLPLEDRLAEAKRGEYNTYQIQNFTYLLNNFTREELVSVVLEKFAGQDEILFSPASFLRDPYPHKIEGMKWLFNNNEEILKEYFKRVNPSILFAFYNGLDLIKIYEMIGKTDYKESRNIADYFGSITRVLETKDIDIITTYFANYNCPKFQYVIEKNFSGEEGDKYLTLLKILIASYKDEELLKNTDLEISDDLINMCKLYGGEVRAVVSRLGFTL